MSQLKLRQRQPMGSNLGIAVLDGDLMEDAGQDE
jgi:hypothetical protein